MGDLLLCQRARMLSGSRRMLALASRFLLQISQKSIPWTEACLWLTPPNPWSYLGRLCLQMSQKLVRTMAKLREKRWRRRRRNVKAKENLGLQLQEIAEEVEKE